MLVRFWGTRGSIAMPGPSTLRYGGNTSCVELRSSTGTRVVIDCGTGAFRLGQKLLQEGGDNRGHLLISHTHWDHINGLPFFAPLFVKGEWDIYGPAGLNEGLRQTLAGQMEHTYFPVSLDQLSAQIRYHDLVEGSFSIDDIQITARYLNHPALTLGYRFKVDGVTVVYSCDHEPHSPAAASGDVELSGRDSQHAAFLEGADLVLHDSQYLAREYAQKTGWGHSTAEYVVRACQQAGVGKVVLTHHDPMRNDDAIDELIKDMRQRVASSGTPLEVAAAAEGETIELSADARTPDSGKAFPARTPLRPESLSRQIMLQVGDPDIEHLLLEAISLEGLPRPVMVENQDQFSKLSSEDCALVILEDDPPNIDALGIARFIRDQEPEDAVRMPIVVVSQTESSDEAREIATDWLIAPFSLSYARTKIRSWMLRVACRWIRAKRPPDEAERLQALRDLAVLDTPAESRFDRITRIAAATFDVPMALVSLVDHDRQWFKSRVGLKAQETSRDAAFCAHAVEKRADVVVPDALLDERFADNPLVSGDPRIRFYAGAPLMLENGRCVGTLCILDHRPRNLSAAELESLHDLRDMVLRELADSTRAD